MADRFYGLDRGETVPTVDTSTTGKDVEVTVDQAVGLTSGDQVILLSLLIRAIQEDANLTEV